MAIPPYSSYYNKNALVCNEKSNTFDTEILESDQINMIRKVPFFQISVNIVNFPIAVNGKCGYFIEYAKCCIFGLTVKEVSKYLNKDRI